MHALKWQLQEAKNRFSELVRKAQADGPQVITLRGADVAVVMASADYQRLTAQPQGSLVEFLSKSPLAGADLDLSRSRDSGRKVSL